MARYRGANSQYPKEFTTALSGRGVRTNPLPVTSPNLNGRCERFVQTIKLERLGMFIIFGKRHLDHLVTEFTEYCNAARFSMVRDISRRFAKSTMDYRP
jgi:hypothetical protein